MEHKPSPKGMILDIGSMRSRAQKLTSDDPKYARLLESITETDYYNDEDLPLPTLKSLAEAAQLSPNITRRLLQKIYEDLNSFENQDRYPFEFNELEIRFGIQGFNGCANFTAKQLSVIPRQGEMVHVPFFKELTGTDYYHVDQVHHYLSDNKQKVYLSLKVGSFNKYWKLRLDQAEFTGEISLHDSFSKEEYQLREMLNLKPSKAW